MAGDGRPAAERRTHDRKRTPSGSGTPPGRPFRDSSPGTIDRIVGSQAWGVLDEILGALDPHGTAKGRLREYVRLVVDWNRKSSNLISKNDESKIVSRHILESLAPARLLDWSGIGRIVDVGSGAGFPAIPLAIVGIGGHWTLVESRRPKALFLRRVVQDLELKSIEIVHSRFELLEPGVAPFDALTSRATMPLPETLEAATPRIRPGGKAILWKGERWREEIEDPRHEAHWTQLERVTVPDSHISVLVFARK